LTSSVLVWPSKIQVDEALRRWAADAYRTRPELRRLGCFGSYARGDWGVGSDLDLVAIVTEADTRRDRRGLDWDLTNLPVPAEIVIFTEDEWKALDAMGSRFVRTLEAEAVWVSKPH
jgi:predicted nucleotidyltransferase